MCHPVIVEYVKAEAPGRRDLFRGSAAGAAMAGADQMPATGVTLVVAGPRHQDVTGGGPCRLIALV